MAAEEGKPESADSRHAHFHPVGLRPVGFLIRVGLLVLLEIGIIIAATA
jgi:hypothetical protein